MADGARSITDKGTAALDRRPGVPVIDTHIHLWDRAVATHPWLERWPHLGDRVDADLLSATAEGLAGAVFIEAATRPEDAATELAWLADQASRCSFPIRVVAQQLPGDVRWWAGRPGADLVAGVRRVMHTAAPGELVSAGFVADALAAGGADLVVDLTVRHEQLEEVAQLAAGAPETRFVLDHLGKPAPHQSPFGPWADALAAVAALPNVVCKLSSIAVQPENPPFRAAEAEAYVAHALQVFGPGRCMYGTDWPVVSHAASIAEWLDVVTAALADHSLADRQRVFAGTARDVYGFAS